MQWRRMLGRTSLLKHKYAINAGALGDNTVCAWSNLGFWDTATESYPQASRQLAAQLAHALKLNPNDRLLDLGCGQGASLHYWLNQHQLRQVSAVELQAQCVTNIQKQIPHLDQIYCDSFLNLQALSFQKQFDVVLCIDAAYHSNLAQFLNSVSSVLLPAGRLGFHYLMLSERWHDLKDYQRQQYQYLLKAADVDVKNLAQQQDYVACLMQHHFEHIEIVDISKPVLLGFSNYIAKHTFEKKHGCLDILKIKMTARLCKKLYDDGLIRYVQICAVKHA